MRSPTLGSITGTPSDESAGILPPVFTYAPPEAQVEPLEAADYGTDLDASLRFAEEVKDRLRYCPGIGWLAWDGKRWASGETAASRAVEESKQAARKWTMQATRAPDDAARAERVKRALALEGAAHVKNAADLAKSDSRVCIAAAALDRDAFALNVQNGTLDLRAGTLRPHNRADFITKLAPVNYVPQARHPALGRYLATVSAEVAGMGEFLARCAGCALTGDASVESVFLIQGPGGNGKTTLVESIAKMLGDYSVKLDFATLCSSKHGSRKAGAASPDLVPLRGARLAYASEGDQSARLDSGVVKLLTGGESITARPLYESPVTFDATFKLWLASNYDPRADADDSGLWRRMVKLQFPALPPEKRDPAVKITLTEDPAGRSALLAWAVEGCRDWLARGGGRKGLGIPAEVEAVTQAYRAEQDTTGAWFAELLADVATLDGNAVTANRVLRQHYETWCAENGAMALSLPRFSLFLAERGLVKRQTKNGMEWRGIRFETQQ